MKLKGALAISLFQLPLSLCVTIYNSAAQARLDGSSTATTTTTSAGAAYTGYAAYDPTLLTAPSPPEPGITTQFAIELEGTTPMGASIPQSGDFVGLSIEFSVADQVIGYNSTLIAVPFLNLVANLVARGGHMRIRVGGNSQDYATMVPDDSLPDGEIIKKGPVIGVAPTETPGTWFTPDVIYMLANVSAFLNVGWWLGIPLNSTSDLRLAIAEVGETVLGDRILGFQVGNEPDLYYSHGHRPQGYDPADYISDFQTVIDALDNDPVITNRTNLIGPSISGSWTPESVWNAGFIDALGPNLDYLSVEHYPMDNCYALYPSPDFIDHDPQALFIEYLSRAGNASATHMVADYLNSTNYAQEVGKPIVMFETNSASCGGFPGISDSFGATLWLLDSMLQMAYVNFSGANVHVSGQDVYYNPFSPPPSDQDTTSQWSVFAPYYSLLAMAETLGSSNRSQVVDLNPNDENPYTPAYAIYENGVATRVALFNYVTDPTGDSTLHVTVQVPSNPASVQVKFLGADSVGQKAGITWANQTFGSDFQSDGTFQGTESIQTVACRPSISSTTGASLANCTISVPAPGFALVFLSPKSLAESNNSPSSERTFSTTSVSAGTAATVQVAPSVLETSNGHTGKTRKLGSTSRGSSGAASLRMAGPGQRVVVPALALAFTFAVLV